MRTHRIGVPPARLRALRIVTDDDRGDAAVEIEQRREPVAVRHHNGIIRERELIHVAGQRTIRVGISNGPVLRRVEPVSRIA